MGRPGIKPGGWCRQDIDLTEVDPRLYTGPDGTVWILALVEERQQVASIGFTSRDLRFCETDQHLFVDFRIREALGKMT